jgi:hypothetical protein
LDDSSPWWRLPPPPQLITFTFLTRSVVCERSLREQSC